METLHASPVTHGLPRALATALVGSLVLAGAACDGGGGGDDPGEVQGTWALVADSLGAEFIRVEGDQIEVFSEDTIADCYERLFYEVLEVSGSEFEITDQVDTFSVELRRDGDQLIVSAFGDAEAYSATSVDLTTLPVCVMAGPDVECGDLQSMRLGLEMGDAIEATDSRNPDGSHFDLYRIEVTERTDLVVEMSSSDVDSQLLVFDASGEFTGFANDDASDLTLDARVAPTLDAGCWIVMATTSGPAEFGFYTTLLSNP